MGMKVEKWRDLLDRYAPAPIKGYDQPIPGDPWVVLDITCKKCQGKYRMTARRGDRGTACPHCGAKDPGFIF